MAALRHKSINYLSTWQFIKPGPERANRILQLCIRIETLNSPTPEDIPFAQLSVHTSHPRFKSLDHSPALPSAARCPFSPPSGRC